MFKLVVLSALLAIAAARPGLYESPALVYSAPIVQEKVLAKVGEVVNSVPTAVSHQSSTVVHDSAHVVQPIVAPVVKTYATAPIVQAVHAPLVQTYAAVAPVLNTVHSPLVQTYAVAAPAHYTYAAASPIAYHSAPLTYAAAW